MKNEAYFLIRKIIENCFIIYTKFLLNVIVKSKRSRHEKDFFEYLFSFVNSFEFHE